jgi:hypothetical protein
MNAYVLPLVGEETDQLCDLISQSSKDIANLIPGTGITAIKCSAAISQCLAGSVASVVQWSFA